MFRGTIIGIDVKCFVIIIVLFLGGIIVGLTIVPMFDLWLAALVGVVLTLVSLYKTKQDGGALLDLASLVSCRSQCCYSILPSSSYLVYLTITAISVLSRNWNHGLVSMDSLEDSA